MPSQNHHEKDLSFKYAVQYGSYFLTMSITHWHFLHEAQVKIFHHDIVSHYNFCTLLWDWVNVWLGLQELWRMYEVLLFLQKLLAAMCVKCL